MSVDEVCSVIVVSEKVDAVSEQVDVSSEQGTEVAGQLGGGVAGVWCRDGTVLSEGDVLRVSCVEVAAQGAGREELDSDEGTILLEF